jgi:DNA modification methylase
MKLSDNEIRDINRLLESGKPLPDKYRFLLFEDKHEVELVWNDKTNEVCNVALPFQTIEQVDEPRAELPEDTALQSELFATDARGRQLKGWTNKLIWGDNKLILSSLKNGPLREEIEAQGGLKLIYIDPPFDVGADFSMDIEIGDEAFTKKPNILEEIAYRDTWGQGADSFISMIYERLVLMRDLLADDGSIYVHCDWHINGYLRLVLDEVFGKDKIIGEIIWQRITSKSNVKKKYGAIHDTIYYFTKNPQSFCWNQPFRPLRGEYVEQMYRHVEEKTGRRYRVNDLTASMSRASAGQVYEWRGQRPPASRCWVYAIDKMEALDKEGKIYWSRNKYPGLKHYLDESDGEKVPDLWDDIGIASGDEQLYYPTQKPESLLERIIQTSSNEGDIVADFFCGSGTTAAVAEKLGRKWIACDLGKFAVHTTRKRMIGVQRGLKDEGKNYRAFEILNLGKYERQHFIGVNADLREKQKQQQIAAKEAAFLDLILRAYRAEKTDGFATFHGKRAGRLVAIGPVNLPVTRLFVEEIILECRKQHITKVDILGFEFEMGLFPNVLDEARSKGIDISPKYIPVDVFDKRAVEKNQVVFHDVAFIEVKPHVKGENVAVELTDFSVFYSQDSIANAEEGLKKKGSRIVVERGQIVKVSKDKDSIVNRETLTENWTDWIDYWSVDFDFESKREIIRTRNPETGDLEEQWTGDFIFENEWQSFRTRKDRSLELTSVAYECSTGRRKVAVKVVDIFGNDTMALVEVNIEGAT